MFEALHQFIQLPGRTKFSWQTDQQTNDKTKIEVVHQGLVNTASNGVLGA